MHTILSDSTFGMTMYVFVWIYEMEQFKLKVGQCFALISNHLGDLIFLLLGAAIFIERALTIVQQCNNHIDKRSYC